MGAAIGVVLLIAAAGSASAAPKPPTYAVSISGSAPNLGNVVSAASGGDTTWRVNPSTQAVTLVSGGSVRLSTNPTRASVTVSCSGSGCNAGTVNVQVGTIGSPTKRARKLTNLTVAMGTATLTSSVSGSDPIAFSIDKIGAGSKTFYVGADFAVAADDSGLATGLSTSGFYVSVAKAPAIGAASGTGAAVATVYRPISISNPQALAFATIVKPRTGSGSISVSKVDGSSTVTGGVLIGTTKQAKFVVTGEGGGSFTLSIPSSFNMTGPGAIQVNLDSSGTSPATLSSSLGSAGTYSFNVGGAFAFDSSTPTGAYTGQFSVVASYN